MKFNEKQLSDTGLGPAEIEGRLSHKRGHKSETVLVLDEVTSVSSRRITAKLWDTRAGPKIRGIEELNQNTRRQHTPLTNFSFIRQVRSTASIAVNEHNIKYPVLDGNIKQQYETLASYTQNATSSKCIYHRIATRWITHARNYHIRNSRVMSVILRLMPYRPRGARYRGNMLKAISSRGVNESVARDSG